MHSLPKHAIIAILLTLPLSGYALDDQALLQPSKEIKKEKRIRAVAKEDTESTTTQKELEESVATIKEEPEDFTLCSQQAIEERDTKIAASRTIYNQAMNTALQERKHNEKLAVAIKQDDDKKAAIKKSVESYKTLVKNAQTTLTAARKEAWKGFEEDLEGCRTLQNTKTTEEGAQEEGESSIRKEETIKDTILNTIKSLFN